MSRVAALAALLVAGCTVGPDYKPPTAAAPNVYAEASGRAGLEDGDLASWWRLFGDTRLESLVNRAVAQNLDVQSAAARIREARAREIVAGAAGRPQVGVQGSISRQRISENAIPLPPGTGTGGGEKGVLALPGTEFSTFRAGFDASWEIDFFGGTRRSVEAAGARTEEALWDRRAVQVSVAAEVADAYLSLRTIQERIATAEAEVARQQRSEQLVAARVRGGLVTGQDLEQQKSERLAAAASIPPLRAEAQAQIHALGVLTGDTPEALVAELTPNAALPPAPPPIPAGIPSDLLRRRPDIRAAERELAAATADIGVAVAELYPRFSLTAAPALVSTALGSLLEWGSRSFTAAGAVDWPFLDGGRTRGKIAVADARQEQALIAYRRTVLRALQDVEDSLSGSDGDRREVAQLKEALRTATRAEEIARARYRGGLTTFSDVLQAQARRLELEDRLTQAEGALARNTVALFKALGGGWPDLAQGKAQQ